MSVRIVAALLIILIGSAFSEDVRSRIWSCRIVSWLEREELIESQSVLWYNLTLTKGKILLLKFVKKSKRMAEWSEERSSFKVRFWIKIIFVKNSRWRDYIIDYITAACSAVSVCWYAVISNEEVSIVKSFFQCYTSSTHFCTVNVSMFGA